MSLIPESTATFEEAALALAEEFLERARNDFRKGGESDNLKSRYIGYGRGEAWTDAAMMLRHLVAGNYDFAFGGQKHEINC